MAPANAAGPSEPDLSPPSVADADELRRRIEAGEWVVDLRNRTAFAAGHAPGTLNFGLDGGFATYLGWLIAWGTPITLLGETAEDVAEAQRELVRIGIDRPAAHATGEPGGLERPRAELVRDGHLRRPRPGAPPPRGGRPGRAPRRRARRGAHRRRRQHPAPRAARDRLGEVPAGEVWVHCAGGYRASVAASMLDAAGRSLVAIDDSFDNAEKVGPPPGGARGVTPRPRRRRRRAHRAQPGRARRRRVHPRRPGAGLRPRAEPGPGHHRLAGGGGRDLAGRRRHGLRAPATCCWLAASPSASSPSAAPWSEPRASTAVPEPVLLGALRGADAGRRRAARRTPVARPPRRARRARRAPPDARRPDHHLQPDLRLPVPARPQGARHRHGRRPADRLPGRRAAASSSCPRCWSRSACRCEYAVGTSLVVITMTSAVALVVRAGSGVAPDWGLVIALTAARPLPQRWSASGSPTEHRHPPALGRLHRPRPRWSRATPPSQALPALV